MQQQESTLSFENFLMYQQSYLFTFALGLIGIVLFLRSTNPYERVAIVSVAGVMLWYIWNQFRSIDAVVENENKTIEGVLSNVKGFIDFDIIPPVRYILNSDKQLLKALDRLAQFKDYDIQIVRNIIKGIVKFYEHYAEIISENNVEQYRHMIDIRSDILQTLDGLKLSISYMRHNQLLDGISLVIKGATYKALNVIRNKFHRHKLNTFILKPPYPINLYKQNMDAFEIVYSNSADKYKPKK